MSCNDGIRYIKKRITKIHVHDMRGVHPMFGPGEYKSVEEQIVLQVKHKGQWVDVPLSDEIISVEVEV